jgi:putative ABC transport system substrate-binding protein
MEIRPIAAALVFQHRRLCRAFLALAIGLLASAASDAQTGTRVPRVGVLHAGSASEPAAVQREPLERGLRELGWIPGATVIIDYRYGEGSAAQLSAHAADLVRSRVDLIVARADRAIEAARRASATVPIVMSAGTDPIAEGLVTNLSRPGGNITGVASIVYDLDAKRLELLKEAFPKSKRVAVLVNPAFDGRHHTQRMAALRANGERLGFQLQTFEVHKAEDLPETFAAIQRGQFDALFVRPDPQVIDVRRGEIAAQAAQQRLPAMYPWRFFVEAGGLISYGPSLPDLHYRAAAYVSRILKGAKPGDLAIQQPTTYELAVNLGAANAQGLTLPKEVLFRADKLIQ